MPEKMGERRDQTVLNMLRDIQQEQAVISKELAINTVETRNTRERLDKLKGSVSNHDSRLHGIERNQDLLTANLKILTDQRKGTSDTFRRWSDKVIWGAVIIITLLFYAVLVKTGVISNFIQ